MINTIEQFGRNAGKVWKALKDNNSLSDIELIELTSLREYELYIAIGWLAKENKIRRDGEYFKLDISNITYQIGQNAGIIWRLLYTEGDLDIKGLFTKLKIDEKDAYSAIGWLARENKIKIKKGYIQNQMNIM
jgi:hypothetical protein